MTKPAKSIEPAVGETVAPEVEHVINAVPTVIPTTLKFKWSENDQKTVDTLRALVDQRVMTDHREAFSVIQGILAKVRTQEVDPATGELAYDEHGNPVWKRNPDKSIVEDYGKLDAVDLDSAILKLATYAFFASGSVSDTYAEAVFAKFAADDAFDDAVSSIHDGTVQAIAASANRKARDDRYFAFFKSYAHKRVKDLVERMDSLRRTLETVRKYQTEDRSREYRASGNR